MKILKLAFSFLLLFNLLLAKEIVFLTHEIRPFAFKEQGKLKGFAVELVSLMMKENNHPVKFKVYPFKRALYTLKTQKNHALFIVAKRPERESLFKWVGPLVSSGVYFYKRAGDNLEINSFEDIKKLKRVGVALGNADHTFLKSMNLKNLSVTNKQTLSIKQLVLGRIDVTPISELVLPKLVKEANLDISTIKKTKVKLYDSVLYLVFSKDVPNEVVKKWQDSLEKLKNNGVYNDIYNRYIQK